MGNLGTKIFHNNTCAKTNEYAAALFAKNWQGVPSHGTSNTDGRITFNENRTRHLEYTVLPREFTQLATGGPTNNFLVEGIVHRAGKIFRGSGHNAMKSIFSQS